MIASTDEHFYGLAMNVASGRGTPAEQAELDGILAAEPTRAADFEKVKKNVAFTLRLIPHIYLEQATVAPLGEKYRQRFHEHLAKLRAAALKQVESPALKILSPREMESLILKTLSETKMDGFELCSRLRRVNVQLANKPEAAIYRILDDLEASGHLDSEWVDRQSRRLKVYRLTEKIGWGALKAEKVAENISALADTIKGLA